MPTTVQGPGGLPARAAKFESPIFAMSALVTARGKRRDVLDWDYGFIQTMHRSDRRLCWSQQHEVKDELANYGGQILDSLKPTEAPWTRQSDVKSARLLPRILLLSDRPSRSLPLQVGSGDCLQSIDWQAAFSTRLVARKRGSGSQPICPLFHADWEFGLAAAPALSPISGGGGACTTSLGAVTSTTAVTSKGPGPGSGPFETASKGGVVANEMPEMRALDLQPGPC